MGRRKVSMGLIPNRRVRVNTFGKRKEGLKKKAGELSVLCGVDVALVVAAADGGDGGAGAADVWESKEGVLARYRELDPEVRARHTHRAYLQGELGKGEAKLARVRQGGPHGLDRWDKALDGVATAEEAQQLIDAVDAAIRATDDRKRTLGLPIDDEDGGAGVVLEGIAPLSFAGVDDYLLHAPGGDTNDQAMWGGYGGFQFQQGSAANMQQAGYGFQPCASSGGGADMESYHLQMAPDMYGNSDYNGHLALADAYQQYQPRDAGTMPHVYGFPCAHASYFGLPSGYQMQQQVLPQPDLSMWCADEPRHDMLPLEYPSTDTGLNYADTPAAHGGQGIGGRPFAGNFINSPPALSLAMGTGGGGNFINASPAGPSYTMGATGDNFTNATAVQPLAISYGGDLTIAGSRYATQWLAAPQPQHAGSDQKPGIEHLHYLSDRKTRSCTSGETNLPSSYQFHTTVSKCTSV